jgi:hypothetical protein
LEGLNAAVLLLLYAAAVTAAIALLGDVKTALAVPRTLAAGEERP